MFLLDSRCQQIYDDLAVSFIPSVCGAAIVCHAEHARSVRLWFWTAAVCSTGGGCQCRVAPCTDGTSPAPMATCWEAFQTQRLQRERLGQLIDAMDRSGQQMQLSRWEQSQAAEPAGDEPAAAGDGAGDDKPAERRSGSAPSPASSPTGQWRTACTAPLLSFKTHTRILTSQQPPCLHAVLPCSFGPVQHAHVVFARISDQG